VTPGQQVLLPSRGPTPVHRARVASTAGGELAVAAIGPPTAPAWVVAHGAGSSARFVAAAFAGPVVAAGGRLVTYDLRGHGASALGRTVADHHLDVHSADLVAVAASVTGPVAVVGGVSLGGHAAVHAAARGLLDTEVVLACLPAWTGRAVPGEGPHAAIAEEVRTGGAGAVLARVRREPGLPVWLRETLLLDHARHDQASLGAALVSLDGGTGPEVAELAALPVPLAVVAWDDDPGHPLEVAREWAAATPTGSLVVLDLLELERGLEVLGDAAVAAVRAAVATT
jgi:pimeloyl-ACP methyl ester carboxylesterase